MRGKEVVDETRRLIVQQECATVAALKARAHLVVDEEYRLRPVASGAGPRALVV